MGVFNTFINVWADWRKFAIVIHRFNLFWVKHAILCCFIAIIFWSVGNCVSDDNAIIAFAFKSCYIVGNEFLFSSPYISSISKRVMQIPFIWYRAIFMINVGNELIIRISVCLYRFKNINCCVFVCPFMFIIKFLFYLHILRWNRPRRIYLWLGHFQINRHNARAKLSRRHLGIREKEPNFWWKVRIFPKFGFIKRRKGC